MILQFVEMAEDTESILFIKAWARCDKALLVVAFDGRRANAGEHTAIGSVLKDTEFSTCL